MVAILLLYLVSLKIHATMSEALAELWQNLKELKLRQRRLFDLKKFEESTMIREKIDNVKREIDKIEEEETGMDIGMENMLPDEESIEGFD